MGFPGILAYHFTEFRSSGYVDFGERWLKHKYEAYNSVVDSLLKATQDNNLVVMTSIYYYYQLYFVVATVVVNLLLYFNVGVWANRVWGDHISVLVHVEAKTGGNQLTVWDTLADTVPSCWSWVICKLCTTFQRNCFSFSLGLAPMWLQLCCLLSRCHGGRHLDLTSFCCYPSYEK